MGELRGSAGERCSLGNTGNFRTARTGAPEPSLSRGSLEPLRRRHAPGALRVNETSQFNSLENERKEAAVDPAKLPVWRHSCKQLSIVVRCLKSCRRRDG